MLAGQHLGRRHERAPGAPASTAVSMRQQRDDGLAAADIALQQAQHAVGLARSASISASARACAPVS